MIEAAAIRTADGKVWVMPRPGRHHHVWAVMAQALEYDIEVESASERKRWLDYTRDQVSGFVTDKGVFLDRSQALEHVRACRQEFSKGRGRCGQPVPDNEIIGGELTSEYLW